MFTWRRVNGRFGREFIVKVGHIIFTRELGQEWRRHPPLQHLIPTDPGEESVLLNGQGVPLTRAKPLFHGPVEQPLDNVFCVRCQVILELKFASEDPLCDGLSVVAGKWRRSRQHVVDKDTKTPPVNLLTMPTVKINSMKYQQRYFTG